MSDRISGINIKVGEKERDVFVTFTGVDQKTDLNRLERITNDYGSVEFAVLTRGPSATQSDKNRFPHSGFIHEFSAVECYKAIHLCKLAANGPAVRGNVSEGEAIGYSRFGRIQVNALQYDLTSIFKFQRLVNREVIVQWREPWMPYSIGLGIVPLFDRSSGKGILPANFPPQHPVGHVPVGYAGGIGPDNVLDVLSRIDAHEFWIDMETGVRTDDDWFDLDKCERVLEQVFSLAVA